MSRPIDELAELDVLGAEVLRRLESSEALSTVLPAARRFFVLDGEEILSAWLRLETVGLEGDPRKAEERSSSEQIGALLFGQLRRATNPDKFDVNEVLRDGRTISATFPDRDMVLYQSVAELESREKPLELGGASRYDAQLARAWGKTLMLYHEAQRVLNLVRQTTHRLTLERHRTVRERRTLLELFGNDALAVFAAGGALLAELQNAAVSLARPGLASTAAQQARTAILTLGRELYTGDGAEHVSPITGRRFKVSQEVNKLHVVVDDLWERAAVERRSVLADAHGAIETAYELGSRAKNPLAITYEQALEAVRAAFRVAHAICFAGGFPAPAPASPAPVPSAR